MARQIDQLPEQERTYFAQQLHIGQIFTHKTSGRDWEVKQIFRKDHQVLLIGPGVEKKMTISYDDLKRHWRTNG